MCLLCAHAECSCVFTAACVCGVLCVEGGFMMLNTADSLCSASQNLSDKLRRRLNRWRCPDVFFLRKRKLHSWRKPTLLYLSVILLYLSKVLLHNGRYAALSAYIIIKAYESLSAAFSVQFYMWKTAWISIWFTPCVVMMSGQKVVQKRCYV